MIAAIAVMFALLVMACIIRELTRADYRPHLTRKAREAKEDRELTEWLALLREHGPDVSDWPS